jgi:hypothetical protein
MKYLLLTAALAFTMNSYSQVEVTTAPKTIYKEKNRDIQIVMFIIEQDTSYSLLMKNDEYRYIYSSFFLFFKEIKEIDQVMDYCLQSFKNPDNIYEDSKWRISYLNSMFVMLICNETGNYKLMSKKLINGVKTFIAGYSNN